jgi:hypothetical protein
MLTVPLTAVLPNRQVFLPDPIVHGRLSGRGPGPSQVRSGSVTGSELLIADCPVAYRHLQSSTYLSVDMSCYVREQSFF